MKSGDSKYEATIGIETHVQLKTKTKLFCACLNDSASDEPNTNICPVCMGMPGTLPVLNEQAVKLALRVGLALNSQEIVGETKFDRKNYFYPDLPKGYQISQYDQPIVGKGHVQVPYKDGEFEVGITRAHLEEDAGKLIHPAGADYSLLDLNRAGTPLIEIVSEPDIKSPAQAKAYVQELYNLMRYGDVSNVDLYRGNMRFDVNVSIAKKGEKLGTRAEIKNLNSFRSVEKAAEYEIKRQTELLAKGEKVVQETRGWDDAKGKTIAQRTKEEANDYRYFPEPDLPPMVITKEMLRQAQHDLPVLPDAIRSQLAGLGVEPSDREVMIGNPHSKDLFEATINLLKNDNQKKQATNWLVNDHQMWLKETGQERSGLSPENFAEFIIMIDDGEIPRHQAKGFWDHVERGKSLRKLVEDFPPKLLGTLDVEGLEEAIRFVISSNGKAVADYHKGNANSLQFLVGQVMKETKGRANPQVAHQLLLKMLK